MPKIIQISTNAVAVQDTDHAQGWNEKTIVALLDDGRLFERTSTCGASECAWREVHGPLTEKVTTSASQQLGFLGRNALSVIEKFTKGFTYDPGHSDLVDEQPINITVDLGDIRAALQLEHELRKM